MTAQSWLYIASLVAAVVVALATVLNVYLMYQSVRETRLLRQLQDEPHIVVSTWLKSPGSNLVYMWVENTGSGAAYSVRLSTDKVVDAFPLPVRPLTEVGAFKTGVPCFPPRHQLSFYLGESVALRKSDVAVLEITATYQDRAKKNYCEVFRIDAHSLVGMTDMTESGPLDHIRESIDRMTNAIQSHS